MTLNMFLTSFMVIVVIASNVSIVFTSRISYPKARRDETVKDIKFGIEIKDPYRWLEDPNSDETKAFITAQNNITVPYLESCPYREQIRNSFRELLDFPKVGIPRKYGQKYFYTSNTGLQNFAITYMKDSLFGESKVFLDPNNFSNDGSTALSFILFSNDGKWCAYGISQSGSDWMTIKFRDVQNGLDLNENLTKLKFYGPSFTIDNKGVFYSKYDGFDGNVDGIESSVATNPKLFYHRLNTNPSNDILLAKLPNPHWRFGYPVVSNDGKYLHIFPIFGTEDNLWYFANLNGFTNKINLLPVIKEFHSYWEYVNNDKELHYMLTNYKAPNYRLIAVDLSDPREINWIDVIPEKKDSVLKECIAFHTNLFAAIYSHNVIENLEFYRLINKTYAQEFEINSGFIDNPIRTINRVSGRPDDPELFVSTSSFFTPEITYYYNFNTTPPQIQILNEVKVNGLKSEDFIAKQVFYNSKDGTKVPMFIAHHKKLQYNGNNPTYLYGYGGFNINLKPTFNIRQIFVVKDLDGVYAVANLRGGSEFGDNWHMLGMKLNKQNVFDDFISAAEYLINNNYTKSQKLIINGRSNGGLLVSAVSNQRPDLFGCALPQVGVLDMLRFHKFTVGYAWISEFGNPDEEMDFKNILKYSPLHNIPINTTEYPATLIMTASHDDRVVPMHSLKFGAQLQYSLGHKLSETPLLLRITSKTGHGRGLTTDRSIEELVDIFSFVINSLQLQYNQNSINNSFIHLFNYFNVLFLLFLNLIQLSITI